MKKMAFQIYTYFGRVLRNCQIGEDETHHRALEEARVACADFKKNGITCWVRLVR